MQIYLFNPDADMALADNRPTYVAPNTVRQMTQDLALLPFWYADKGGVKVNSADEEDFVNQMNERFERNIVPVYPKEWHNLPETEWMPWGWTPALCHQLITKGADKGSLPSEESLAEWRAMASREHVSAWLEELGETGGKRAESVNLKELSACHNYIEKHQAIVLKAPWSGSGKGLRWCHGEFTPDVAGWCGRLLRKHGLVTASPVYDKVEDFAMEFQSDGLGQIHFEGYSVFDTTSGGAYGGNWLMPDTSFELRIKKYGLEEALYQIRYRIPEIATSYIKSYRGYWGVDMMVCRGTVNEQYWIHPCVEINLRMNMGIVALKLYNHLLAPGMMGRLVIDYLPTPGAISLRHITDQKRFPLRINKKGRIEEGYLALTPVCQKTRYRAALYVGCTLPSTGLLSLP